MSSAPRESEQEHCITCGDVGEAMVVLRVNEEAGLALCRDERGERSTVQTALLGALTPGERILVHAGTAIAALAPDTEGVAA